MKFIAPYYEGDKKYDIYLDENTDKYYKINDEEKIELTGEELIAAKVSDNIVFKVTQSRKAKNHKRVFKIFATLLLAGVLLYGPINEHKQDIAYVINTQNMVDDYNYLREYQASNETLSDELQLKIPQYLQVLSNLGIKESKMVKIGNRLGRMDFRGVDELNVIYQVLDLDDSGFVAKELYCYVNGLEPEYEQGLISNLFSLDRDTAKKLINGESLDKLIKEKFNVKVTTDVLSEKEVSTLENLNKIIEEEMGFIDGEYYLNNNIFEVNVRIGCNNHNIYGEITDEGLDNKTHEVYMKKLYDLVYSNAQYIDYINRDDRFIVYLYANALLNGDFFNMEIDVPDLLYSGVQSNMYNIGLQIVTEEELYTYLDNPEAYDYKNMILLSQLAYLGEYGMYILQEATLCLAEEVKAGNFSQEDYDLFIDTILSIYENIYPNLLPIVQDALSKNKSIDNFQIQLICPEFV